MYAYPTDADQMIDAIARVPNIVKYIDIPLQHMATPVLDLMRRRTTGEQQVELLSSRTHSWGGNSDHIYCWVPRRDRRAL